MRNKIKVGIIGGAGYTGGELIRLLINHPSAEIAYVHSKSNVGKELQAVHQDLIGETNIQFSGEINDRVDVIFLCVGHGDSLKFLEENDIPGNIKIISLSQDFRLNDKSFFNHRKFIYGLPEIKREEIKIADNIANPGCFATAIELGLLPVAKMNLLQDVYTTGITGSTGAGQSMSLSSHFSWRENNVQAYKSLTHQHLFEINETLNSVSGSQKPSIHFVPWRGNFTRGIFITSQLKCTETLPEMYHVFEEFYKGHSFVKISREPIFLKQVVNTNNCFINLEQAGDILVVHSVIDNLLKGASGQAVQNMNLMFGLEETEGLKLKANYF
ncbi:MAG: N-acetyl-gamma-glutamyl-phosphate reductase [Bacteroidota bacterium]|nr:N-acetyl-gamma-glutamyl-phosphate reductase [Bacteroidota bacterium]